MFEIVQTRSMLRLLHAINSDWTNPFLDWFMAFVTDYGLEMADAHCGVGVVHLGAIENGCS